MIYTSRRNRIDETHYYWCATSSARKSLPEREIRKTPEEYKHDQQFDDLEIRVLPVHVQVVYNDVGVFEVTVSGFAVQ